MCPLQLKCGSFIHAPFILLSHFLVESTPCTGPQHPVRVIFLEQVWTQFLKQNISCTSAHVRTYTSNCTLPFTTPFTAKEQRQQYVRANPGNTVIACVADRRNMFTESICVQHTQFHQCLIIVRVDDEEERKWPFIENEQLQLIKS